MRKSVAIAAGLLAFTINAKEQPTRSPFNVVEASISDMQAALKSGRVTSHELVEQYLIRIATYEDKLHAAITVNANALKEADERDRERAEGKVRGPLHGIPIALLDNIQTTNMPTTGGALALDGFVPPYEATVTKRLRDAGAIIIAKTQMTELANMVAAAPAPMPGDYNGVNGYGFNPYDPRRDPRAETFDGRPALNTGGASSGAGTAANFWAANVGTETSGSILSPSNQNMLAGIKPTVGRVSRYGVIPITTDQDTPGPMAKFVADAAIILGAIEGPDPNDPATNGCAPQHDYSRFLKADGLKGARIGIPRAFFCDKVKAPGSARERGGINADQLKVMTEAIDVLEKQGAIIVDPADIPSIVDKNADNNLLLFGLCTSMEEVKQRQCSVDLAYGMERDFNAWLQSFGDKAPFKTLTDLRNWNTAHTKANAIKYGQSLLDISDFMDLDAFKARYDADRAKDLYLTGKHGIDEVMKANNLDALLFAGGVGANTAARPGYPSVIVPFGTVPNAPTPPFPEQFDAKPNPFGITFTGMACSEPTLIKLAYAFEQATKRRVPPAAVP
jgi:amidase